MQSGLSFVSGGAPTTAQSAANDLLDKLKGDISDAFHRTVDHVREDLANGVSEFGAGATNAVTDKLAPHGKKPITIPLTSGQQLFVVVVVLLAIGYGIYRAVR